MKINRPALVVVVRHARSLRNEVKKDNIYFTDDETRKLVAGIADPDIPITEEGFLQAEATGIGLKKEFGSFDYIYHSGYKRTEQTVEGILKSYPAGYSKKVRTSFLIRERDTGYSYEMTTREAETAFPWLQAYWKTYGQFYARPPGGESLADVSDRVERFLRDYIYCLYGKKILIVTHGGTLRVLRILLEELNPQIALEAMKTDMPKNCGVTAYCYQDTQKRLVLKEYNKIYY